MHPSSYALLATVVLLLAGCPSPDTGDSFEPAPDSDVEPDTAATPWPLTLSETGLFSDLQAGTLAPDVRTYSPAFPLWSDGAAKERYIALPNGSTIDSSDPDLWDFPIGTRSWKTFISDGVRVETRYIERVEDDWIRVSYQWREDGSDADAVPDGVLDANGTDHDIPDTGSCFRCHQAIGLLGVGAVQLGDDNPDGTLAAWTEEGLLSDPIEESTAVPGEGNEHAVLGYFHGNCGSCHNDGYHLAFGFELRLRVQVGTSTPQDSPVYQTAMNAPTQHQVSTSVVIAPGNPEASQLYERMSTRGLIQMPPLGTERVDTPTVDQVREWIASLPVADD